MPTPLPMPPSEARAARRPLRRVLRIAAAMLLAAGTLASAEPPPLPADDPVPPAHAPRWWKGNLHTHTFWSDGDDFPEMVAEWYRTHGYHFLALSDHNLLQQGKRWEKEATLEKRAGGGVVERYLARFGPAWVERRGSGAEAEVRLKPFDEFRALVEERGRFLLLPAEEISDSAEGVPVHINASNIRDPLPAAGGRSVREAIDANLRAVEDQAERAGREILAHLNHPNFGYAVTAEDVAHAVLERHFEVFNGHPSVNQAGDEDHPSVERLWDIANTIRLAALQAPPLFGIATDDSHHYHGRRDGARPGRGWTMVRAAVLSPEHLIRALRAGDAYASTGVVLRAADFDPAARTLRVEVEADGDATFTVRFVGTRRGTDPLGTPIDLEALPEARRTALGRERRRFAEAIGTTLAEAAGPVAEYVLRGDELYVRAVITSSRDCADPVWPGQKRQAWTQPVGWSLDR